MPFYPRRCASAGVPGWPRAGAWVRAEGGGRRGAGIARWGVHTCTKSAAAPVCGSTATRRPRRALPSTSFTCGARRLRAQWRRCAPPEHTAPPDARAGAAASGVGLGFSHAPPTSTPRPTLAAIPSAAQPPPCILMDSWFVDERTCCRTATMGKGRTRNAREDKKDRMAAGLKVRASAWAHAMRCAPPTLFSACTLLCVDWVRRPLRQLSRKAKRQMKKALVSTQVQEARGAGKAPSSHAILRAQVPRCLTTLLALLDARLRVARARTHTRPLSLSHYVCVRVYVCTCVRVCKCVCVCVCVYVCVYIYLVRLRVADPYTHTHSHTLTYMCVFQGVTDAKNTHICQNTHTYVNIYVCFSGGTHIYVNVYVKRHANMSTCMCVFQGVPEAKPFASS